MIRPLAAVAFTGLLLAGVASAQSTSGGDSGSAPPDSTIAPADTTVAPATTAPDTTEAPAAATTADTTATAEPRVTRTFLSTDGAISVYEEAQPGEGIDGFWWEYDREADLERLVDRDRRGERLEPLRDAFGFELVVPDSIRALRDSVTSVADSILAAAIDISVSFDPKFTSKYNESKDRYTFNNELVADIPMSRQGNVNTQIRDENIYNRSTSKLNDKQSVSSSFSYRFRPDLTSTFTVARNQDQQRRDDVLESESTNTSGSGRVRKTLTWAWVGDVDASAGASLSENDYASLNTSGNATNFKPDWSMKITRDIPRGKATFDYQGDLSRAARREVREQPDPDDPDGDPLDVVTETDDRNFSNKLNLNANSKLTENYEVRFTGRGSREQFQYISQFVVGAQETRTRESFAFTGNLNATPFEGLSMRVNADLNSNQTDYEVETTRFSRTTNRGGDADITYEAWSGSRFNVKLDRNVEDKDFRNPQAGEVDKKKATMEYKQQITQNVDLTATYLLSLDSYKFDDTEANTGDRDLRNTRSTATLRYNPVTAVSTSLKMEFREGRSVNIHPDRSSANKTDYTYLITPSYTWKVGKASISGDFSGEARYSIHDFEEDDNFLTRGFSTRQRWQHAFNQRLSTELLGTFNFTDEGSFVRSELDGVRRFARSRETRRFSVSSTVQYSPVKGLRTRFTYKEDGDNQYNFVDGERDQTRSTRTQELTMGASYRRKLYKHVTIDLDVSETRKEGPTVGEIERHFFNIRASLEYRPFSEESP